MKIGNGKNHWQKKEESELLLDTLIFDKILNGSHENLFWARSSAWLEHLALNQRVAGSNPVGPIKALLERALAEKPFRKGYPKLSSDLSDWQIP